jgi:hypothetical protein
VRLYVDGVLEATALLATSALWPAVAALNIGAYGAGASTAANNGHNGRIDEAFITADVLSEDQIRCLYAARLTHTLGATPTGVRVNVHRYRKGAALAVADFPSVPRRLHNFTAAALTDEGSGAIGLTNAYPTLIVPLAGADGSPSGAFSFGGAHQGLSATDAGLPSGTTGAGPRSYGCWFKTTATAGSGVLMGWGTQPGNHAVVYVGLGVLTEAIGADPVVSGPFVADGQWHQVVVVSGGATDSQLRRLYLDGRAVGGLGGTTPPTLTLAGADRFRVGAAPDGTSPFTGQIDGAFVVAGGLYGYEILPLYAKGSQDLGVSPKNAGDHIERADASSLLFIGDTLESQHTVDVGVMA